MKKTERADKIFGTNYKLVIGAFLFLIFAMPMVLFFFEHKSYVEEKSGAVYRIQSKTDEKIQSVKTLLNYTFFDEEFQERLKKIGAGGEQEDYEKIFAQLTSMTILGDVIKDVWYFPKAENGGVVESGAVVCSDYLTAYLADNAAAVNKFALDERYARGEYFFFRIREPGGENLPSDYAAIGHWVTSTAAEDYFEPIGIGLALLNLPVLADNFSEIKDMRGVHAVLCDGEENVLSGTAGYEYGGWDKSGALKMKVSSRFFGLKTILYFERYQIFLDFLPFLLGIAAVFVFVCLCFYIYIRANDKKRLSSYQSFIGKVAGSKSMGDVVRGMPVVTGADGVKRMQGAVNNYGYLAINNDVSETKKRKILELMNWIFTEEGDTALTWGLEGEHWEKSENGEKKSLLPLDNAGNQYLLKSDSVAPAAYRIKGIASWETEYTNYPRSYVTESEQIRTAWDTRHLIVDELYFVRVPNEYITLETELKDKVSTVCKNIVATIRKNPAATRENLWNSLLSYWKERGGDYIKAKNEAAKAVVE